MKPGRTRTGALFMTLFTDPSLSLSGSRVARLCFCLPARVRRLLWGMKSIFLELYEAWAHAHQSSVYESLSQTPRFRLLVAQSHVCMLCLHAHDPLHSPRPARTADCLWGVTTSLLELYEARAHAHRSVVYDIYATDPTAVHCPTPCLLCHTLHRCKHAAM